MSILDRIAGLGSSIGTSLKGKVESAFTDKDGASDGDADSVDSDGGLPGPRPPAMDEAAARRILGLGESFTLDEVRARAEALARPALAGAVDNDQAGLAALGDVATAAELLEERLLPVSSPSSAGGSASGGPPRPTGTPGASPRARATARR
jgi:hypothetical protein